jgi:hypothetical protein
MLSLVVGQLVDGLLPPVLNSVTHLSSLGDIDRIGGLVDKVRVGFQIANNDIEATLKPTP